MRDGPLMTDPSPLPATAQQIVDSAFRLAQDHGLSAVTSRRVAEYADVSASAVVRYFGSIESLKQRLALSAHRAMGAWRARHRITKGGLSPITAAGVLLSAVSDLTQTHRGLALLHIELLTSKEFPDYVRRERSGSQAWLRIFERTGCSQEDQGIWTDFLHGVFPLALLDDSYLSLASWLPLLAQRLEDRLAGRPSFPEESFPFPPIGRIEDAPPANGAQRILNATLSLLAEQGPQKLTHRSVAAKCGLSVAATTYFFSTKAQTIVAAAHELARRIQRRVTQNLDQWPTSRTLLASDDGQLHPDFLALYALYGLVARDAELRAARDVLRDSRSLQALIRLRHDKIPADRVDAIVFTTLIWGAVDPLRIPQRNASQGLEERTGLYQARMFPTAANPLRL